MEHLTAHEPTTLSQETSSSVTATLAQNETTTPMDLQFIAIQQFIATQQARAAAFATLLLSVTTLLLPIMLLDEDEEEIIQEEMDNALLGNTDTTGSPSTNKNSNEDEFTPPKSWDKKRVFAEIEYITHVARGIVNDMKETNELFHQRVEAMEQTQLIQLAQHLGKQEILETMRASFSSASGDGPE